MKKQSEHMVEKPRVIDIKNVFAAFEGELLLVEDALKDIFKSDVFLIPLIGRYLAEGGGKRMRPLFLLASARLAGYAGHDHIKLAAVIESIHTASLLHDDVVDGADIRRGRASAHSVWGNQVVILVGDFLYSNALKLSVSFGNQKIMETLSAATTRMTEGEVFQLQRSGDMMITEEDYLRIVEAKTGVLISAACRIGAILGGLSGAEEDALASFGLKAGIAFQMADDVLDYTAGEKELGKKLGKDLSEGKITLPLINLIKSATDAERAEIKGLLETGLESGDALGKVLALLDRYGSIESSMATARELVESAKTDLAAFGMTPGREIMEDMADYILQREK